ncbi:sideroflexin-4 isoform X2 [Engystomops pustulosus]|uniref:sideroflexin-4 isoform X2 n=1 Tax=Engystomops pustulosus TaxID=76066 RepID=UPI003AFB2639
MRTLARGAGPQQVTGISEILKSKTLLAAPGAASTASENNEQLLEARRLCEASVHPDSGQVLPLIFRPSVYVLLGAPLAMAALIPHVRVASSFICQLPFQTYNVGFSLVNRNLSMQKADHPLYLSASVLYLTSMGAAPALAMKRLGISSQSARSVLRILSPPLYALLGGLSVALVRFSEVDRGVQIMDQEGNVLGVSHKAAEKAMKETVLSRSALFGVTALVPSLMRHSPHMLRNPRMLTLLRNLAAVVTFGMMVPVSFSLFPHKGSISREDLEEELKEKTSEPIVFYNRGL